MSNRSLLALGIAASFGLFGAGCAADSPTATEVGADATIAATAPLLATSQSNACWGQATKVFAALGEMGPHSSSQPTPRAGLRNLARALADAGIIPDDSMTSLGAFVASALGLSIDACM